MIELIDAEARELEHPDTFDIPTLEDRTSIKDGVFAKLIFTQPDGRNERMWVEVTESSGTEYTGRLANIPVLVDLAQHDSITFEAKHVIDLKKPDDLGQ